MTNIPIITRFTILSIRNHIVFISPTRFQLVPVSRETFLISFVPGIEIVLAKVMSEKKNAEKSDIRKSMIYFFIKKYA